MGENYSSCLSYGNVDISQGSTGDIVHVDDDDDEITEEEEDENDENEEDDEKSAIAIVDLLVLNARQPAQRDGWDHCIGASKIKDTQTRTLTRYRPYHRLDIDRKLCLFFPLPLLLSSFQLISSLFPSLCSIPPYIAYSKI